VDVKKVGEKKQTKKRRKIFKKRLKLDKNVH